jgi:branched-chain amino acid aminotransferase
VGLGILFPPFISCLQLLELFGAGTACVVSPIASISYKDEKLLIPTVEQKYPVYAKFRRTLMDIQYGHVSHPWAVEIDA